MLAFGAGPGASAAHQDLTRAVARALEHAPAARLPLATATYAGAEAPRCRTDLVGACLEIVKSDSEAEILLVKGSVPGARGATVIVRNAVKGA